MVQGSFDRRVVTTRRVEYVIETPYGEPVEAKTLGVVLAQVHHELGDRARSDNAYQVRGEDGRVIISFETEESVSADVAPDHRSTAVSNGAELPVILIYADGTRRPGPPGTVAYRQFDGVRRPTVEIPLSALMEVHLQPRSVKRTTACASMYISPDDVLYQCSMTVAHDRHQAPDDPEDPLVVWWDKQAVPVPWPNDQEPPSCVKVLHDQTAAPDEEPWLCRSRDGWVWRNTLDGPVHEIAQAWDAAVRGTPSLVVTMRTATLQP